MPDAPCIESAVPRDFLAVAALDRIAWLHLGDTYIPDGEHAWRVWCEYATVLIVRHDDAPDEVGDIAGALLMFPTDSGDLFLHKIMVHPDIRGRGLGSALMRHALSSADRPVLLTVDPDNEAAIQLYRNFGFERHRHVPGFYREHEHRDLMIYRP